VRPAHDLEHRGFVHTDNTANYICLDLSTAPFR